jgi:hypothetical protein
MVFAAQSLETMGSPRTSSFSGMYGISSMADISTDISHHIQHQDHGLRDLPTATYPDRKEGVTRRCTREQEAQSYLYFEDAFDSLDRLKELCSAIPVHSIFGTEIDLV